MCHTIVVEFAESQQDAQVILRYRNREVTQSDVEFIRELCTKPWRHRRELCGAVCDAWQWRQANGSPSMYACSDLLLRLEERGLVVLPPASRPNRRGARRAFGDLPLPVDLIPLTWLEVRDPDADLDTLQVRPIEPHERLGWRVYMQRFHRLGDRPMVGEHLMYAAFLEEELVALVGWAAAAFRSPLRDAFVGWDEMTKRKRLHLVANNVRFLVFP